MVARIVLALLVVAIVAPPAGAHHGHDSMRPTTNYLEECATDNFCTTDNSTLTFFSEGTLSPYSRTQIRSVLENQFAPTDLSVSRQDPPSYEGSAETDIVYRSRGCRLASAARRTATIRSDCGSAISITSHS
jgi:hypothetical protein